ncbi:sensor histidine kinase [Desulfocapsa sulfexigens]|nr:hypothetical protein [Desulfocapsa sulfexigens]
MKNAAKHRSFMDANTENSIRQEQIESFGRLMAGFAHDMKNHLGIIRESNGLMGDILEMGVLGGDAKMLERLKKSIDAIERRVVISANMMHHLSGLAHRPDHPFSSFLINDVIKEEYVFLERFSRLKQINIVMELQEMLPAVYNDPSLLQHVVYRIYSQCLELLESGQSLSIVTEVEGNRAVLVFRFPFGVSVTDGETLLHTTLLSAVEKMEGTLTIKDKNKDGMEIRLGIPSLSVDSTS